MEPKFLICRHCGNLVAVIHDSGVPMQCCGEAMEPLTPNTVEASAEKHLPMVRLEGERLTVNVGATDHPMTEEHHIAWICVLTNTGCHWKTLHPGDAPQATFCLGDAQALAVYAYCNLHGLWKTQL